MAATIPTRIPVELTAGDTWRWNVSFPDYPASEGWALTYHFRGVGELNAAAVADGAGFAVTVAAAETATLAAGGYRYIARATLDGVVHTAAAGVVTVRPDAATAAAGALQSHAEKMVALLTASIEARVTGAGAATVKSYAIHNRSVEHYTLDELKKELSRYEWQVWRERHPGQLGPRRQVVFGR